MPYNFKSRYGVCHFCIWLHSSSNTLFVICSFNIVFKINNEIAIETVLNTITIIAAATFLYLLILLLLISLFVHKVQQLPTVFDMIYEISNVSEIVLETTKVVQPYRVVKFDEQRYACGTRYFKDRLFPTNSRGCYRNNGSCAHVVHNNWIVTHEAKVYRFKEHHMWVYDGGNAWTCCCGLLLNNQFVSCWQSIWEL